MKGIWIRKPEGDTCTIFVHGILAREASAWRHPNGTYWPQLLAEEPDLAGNGIYVFFYRTNIFSGSYSIDDAVDALYESLKLDGVLPCTHLNFVCHSMGGIVVRRCLVKQAVELVQLRKKIGLFLVASPSLGSDYADWLEPLARAFGHEQADALRFFRENRWLTNLNKEFKNLKENGILPIRGRELIEDRFVVLGKFWRKQVVEPFSGAIYFANELKIPGSDHFSIATPDGKNALQHRVLREFLRASASASEKPPAASQTAITDTAADTAKAGTAPEAAAPTAVAVALRVPIETLISDFVGSDPLRGNSALEALLERGDAAQAALFASRIEEPATFQVWRRWLRYVRERHESVAPVLLERLAGPQKFGDTRLCSRLFGAIPRQSAPRDALYTLLASGFETTPSGYHPDFAFYDRHGRYDDLLGAYGHAGGSAAILWQIASGSGFYWEKVRHGAFRGACAAFARGELDAALPIGRLVSTVYDDDRCYSESGGMETIGPNDEAFDRNHAIPDEGLWYETDFGAFSWWQRGDVADRILQDWSRHKHWRVRRFGALALRHFRFDRLRRPLEAWRDAESDEKTRRTLQNTIDELALDAVRERGTAETDSTGWPKLPSPNDGEAIVTLARLGHAHPRLDAMRSSERWHDRAMSALAFAYLKRNDAVQRTDRLLKEASNPFETLLLATAVALLGRDDLPRGLHAILVDAGSRRHAVITQRVDVRHIHRFLQVAVADALAIAGTAAEKTAWEREFGPLNSDA